MTKSTVPPGVTERKRAFRVALAERDMTASEFAAMHGVTKQAVSLALVRGRSARLIKAIDRFIAASQRRKRVAA